MLKFQDVLSDVFLVLLKSCSKKLREEKMLGAKGDLWAVVGEGRSIWSQGGKKTRTEY